MEDELIMVGIGILSSAIKNPAVATKLKAQLLKVAADIQVSYGLVPPTTPAA